MNALIWSQLFATCRAACAYAKHGRSARAARSAWSGAVDAETSVHTQLPAWTRVSDAGWSTPGSSAGRTVGRYGVSWHTQWRGTLRRERFSERGTLFWQGFQLVELFGLLKLILTLATSRLYLGVFVPGFMVSEKYDLLFWQMENGACKK